MAVLPLPEVLLTSATEPLAVFEVPVTLFKSALKPMAVLSKPVVLFKNASSPWNVLVPEKLSGEAPLPDPEPWFLYFLPKISLAWQVKTTPQPDCISPSNYFVRFKQRHKIIAMFADY